MPDLASPYLASLPDARVVDAQTRWTSASVDSITVNIVKSPSLDFGEILRIARSCYSSAANTEDGISVTSEVTELPAGAFGGPALEQHVVYGSGDTSLPTYGITVRSGDYLVYVSATTDAARTRDVMAAVLAG